jgi:hypothetical protein
VLEAKKMMNYVSKPPSCNPSNDLMDINLRKMEINYKRRVAFFDLIEHRCATSVPVPVGIRTRFCNLQRVANEGCDRRKSD